MVAPVSRFSKSARTGTRVPRKTHAPLTLSLARSTSGQSDQSNMLHMICFSFGSGQEVYSIKADPLAHPTRCSDGTNHERRIFLVNRDRRTLDGFCLDCC